MIRKTDFCREDVLYVASAREKGFSDGWNENMLNSAVNAGRLFGFIAETDGEKAGFITFSGGMDGVFDLEDVFVEERFRGKGLGKELLTACLNEAAAHGAVKMLLEVRKTNVAAISLYKSFGFSPLCERKKYYADGESASVYIKEF